MRYKKKGCKGCKYLVCERDDYYCTHRDAPIVCDRRYICNITRMPYWCPLSKEKPLVEMNKAKLLELAESPDGTNISGLTKKRLIQLIIEDTN